jgi:hypothetical protein
MFAGKDAKQFFFARKDAKNKNILIEENKLYTLVFTLIVRKIIKIKI